MAGNEDKWIAIQHKTFVNWANEQLSLGNRSVENLAEDLCDGVRLVAIVEALQFKKIGKVYSHPNGRIQMLHNVSLALQAIASDNVKLVNIGNDDIVGGNLKLILGLLWHLIIRYQISSNKSAVPPKKLMLSWFQNALPQMNISNFTSDWRNGIALHALINHLKPGLSPNWSKLSPNDSIQNCRTAMHLAKEHLNVPRVISPEDFASSNLDELSAMTYLSYFIRKNSPGYYNTLNWVCKQLKTTNISNLNTDWNDGYYLCGLVYSLGGEVPGWPNLNRNDHLANCQLGIDCAKKLGIDPILTAAEMSDPNVDHLTVMAYISKFQTVTPRKSKAEKITLDCDLRDVTVGNLSQFLVKVADEDTDETKVKVWLTGPASSPPVHVTWSKGMATCTFQPSEAGLHKLYAQYDGTEIHGCPVTFTVLHDLSKVRVTGLPDPCQVGKNFTIEVFCSADLLDSVEVKLKSPIGNVNMLNKTSTTDGLVASFKPSLPGLWTYQVLVGNREVNSTSLQAFDPLKAWLTGPEHGVIGEEASFNVNIRDCGSSDLETEVEFSGGRKIEDVKLVGQSDVRQIVFLPKLSGVYRVKATIRGEPVKGSPKALEVVDPGQIVVSGEGLVKGYKGVEAYYNVNKQGLAGEIVTTVEVSGQVVPVVKETISQNEFLFHYVPYLVGTYKIDIKWDGKHIPGSPFSAQVTDKSKVIFLTNLNEMKDDNDHIALEYDKEVCLEFDVSRAGPGKLTGEILSPVGKLPVHVNHGSDYVKVSFKSQHEGDHYIHLYWSDVPLDVSPLLAYCPGPPMPLDASKVVVVGRGAEMARATVPARFVIDGKKAGPGVPKVRLQGVQSELAVQIRPLKYNRYQCIYTSNLPGSFLLFVYWSDVLLQSCPFKITITSRGDVRKVKVTGAGLNGGIAGNELSFCVDTVEAGPGEVTAECHSHRQSALCDLLETSTGIYTLKVYPAETEKYILQIRYDGVQVPGSPFILRVGDPPDPSRVKVFGPGIEDGHIDTFESRFLVDTHGAGAGQLAVKIRGPRGGFKVEMRRETENERIINCRYDPSEPGSYEIAVRWSGHHVPGSPFNVRIVETREELKKLISERGYRPHEKQMGWKAEI
ncbi:filamin-A [Biomphalaria glabrata]|uniref:Filamin-A-like isoform X1 n=2 Tax=Biomphalaria glabrata TaxID=6526 RepID=A0A9U8DZI9_BIOGL|nr:filamin-A-like isoform X1 [Biomphalaria glabrata]XP_055869262.1 filamin-A-like isoform X1 [Biomphalaria glabrata]XP_055869263.1 filamin-A-like isoform X1 [Biomphalaria glabrata]KAI8751260.1 filamin-A-like [Biomphalaria glabrata]